MDQLAPAGQFADSIPELRSKRPELPTPPQRHQWFDPWITAQGNAKALVGATLNLIQEHEERTHVRARRRRQADQTLHIARVEAVICNLARSVLLPPPTGRIAIMLAHRRNKRSRYDSPIMGKPMPLLIGMLHELGLLKLRLSAQFGEVSSIAPAPWFARWVAEFGIQLSDLGRNEQEEVILVTRNTRGKDRSLRREQFDYRDTPKTTADREAVRTLNVFLREAEIAFIDDGRKPLIDPFERTMKRRYVLLEGQEVRFDQSGRLYGGFWQNLEKARRWHIRIEGEEVAVLDYSSMFTRLAYAALGAIPPEGDLYAIPGLEGYRSGVKMAMNTFLFDKGPRRSWPSAMGIGVGDDDAAYEDPHGAAARYEARLPEGCTVGQFKKAALRVHPVLKNAWGRQLGFKLMHQESQILLAVLLHLASRNIPALGLHDGLLVAQSHRDIARAVMEEKGWRMTGLLLPVTCKLPAAPGGLMNSGIERKTVRRGPPFVTSLPRHTLRPSPTTS